MDGDAPALTTAAISADRVRRAGAQAAAVFDQYGLSEKIDPRRIVVELKLPQFAGCCAQSAPAFLMMFTL